MKGTETITVVRKPRRDRLNPEPSVEQRFDVEKCIVLPRASREEGKGWVQLGGFTVFAPPDSDIHADDEVICRDVLCAVDGVPGLLRSAKGRDKKLSVTLESSS